jgi:hypothetical protein
MQRGGSVKPARKSNANLLANGQRFENYGHAWKPLGAFGFWLNVYGYATMMGRLYL